MKSIITALLSLTCFLVSASFHRISELENRDVLDICGLARESEVDMIEQRRSQYPNRARKKYFETSGSPSLVHVYNRELGYSCFGVNISPRHVLTYAGCLRTSESIPSISRIRDVIELRHYFAMGEYNREYAYNTSKVVNYLVLDIRHRIDKLPGTFAILEREINNIYVSPACLPPSYQFPQSPDREPLDERKVISYSELCDGSRQCLKRFLGRRFAEKGRIGRGAVFIRAKSMSMYDIKSEMREFFVGFLMSDNSILSIIPFIFSICKQTGVCYDEFNLKANVGHQVHPEMTQVLENGLVKYQSKPLHCRDKITKLDEDTFNDLYDRCGYPLNEDDDHKIAYVSSIHAKLGKDLTQFVCWATLISDIHAIASRQCDFDSFDRGGMWLLYGDQYEDPISTSKKSAVRGYLYLAEYGFSIVELSQPVVDRNISCFPCTRFLRMIYGNTSEFDKVIIEFVRDNSQFEPNRQYYVSDSHRTWLDKAGTPTLLIDEDGYTTLTGIRLRGEQGYSFGKEDTAPASIYVLQLHVISDLICKLLGICPDGYYSYDMDRIPQKYSNGEQFRVYGLKRNIISDGRFCPINPPWFVN